jgi:hypothetical protein
MNELAISAGQPADVDRALRNISVLISGKVDGQTIQPDQYAVRLAELEVAVAALPSLTEAVSRARRTATAGEVANLLSGLLKSVPYDGGKGDSQFFGRQLVEDVMAQYPTIGALSTACRNIRWKQHFIPTIAVILEELTGCEMDLASFDWKAGALTRARDELAWRVAELALGHARSGRQAQDSDSEGTAKFDL